MGKAMKGPLDGSHRAHLDRRVVTVFLFFSGIAFLLGTGTPQDFSRNQAAEKFSGALAFTERVGFQYAIEEVYWRHRIWPKDNSEPKPPLDAIVPRDRIEQKVADYLRKSQLVADHRHWPISASELQAEMDRMASHTRQPDVLRELFAALGNDPFVIAECLAKPILAERFVNALSAHHGVAPFVSNISAQATASASTTQAYKLPEISVPSVCAEDTWTTTSTTNVPDHRWGHKAIWTGSEMVIWGGSNHDGGQANALNTGGRYNPALDTWTPTSITNAPAGRASHTAVWTGTELIVWGGANSADQLLNTGGRYNPITDTWLTTGIVNAPVARAVHTAVWIGSEMIVWGGRNDVGWFNTGGRYNPNTDSWLATSTTNAPAARWDHSALWTGSEMVVWGGTDQTNYLHTGGRYSPATDSWMPTSLVNVPPGRIGHTAVWTGSEMMVWGGVDETFDDCNTGGRYNPVNDSWVATSLNNAPSPRDSQTAVWTGSEMIVWAGIFHTTDLNTGAKYNPASDTWIASETANVPFARYDHTAVWTGNEMIIWGGYNYEYNLFFNTGGRYCAQPSTPIVQSAVSEKTHGNAGSFGINLPLSGTPGIECRSGGATNDYTMVITFLANVSVNGYPQAAVTSGVGTVGTGGVSNGGRVTIAGNVVTVPLTNVANAQTINVTLYGVNGSTNIVIPMSILIGDMNANGIVNASDVSQTKSQVGQPVSSSNFREDVSANGVINSVDVIQVKANVGTALPP